MENKHKNIISVEELSFEMESSNLIVLDASFEKTVSGKASKYEGNYIPNSIYFDLKHRFSDNLSPYPNMFPSLAKFQKECQNLGINSNSKIVVYDKFGMYSSARVWWMFKILGHDNVAVLDGGLPEWIEQNKEVVQYLKTSNVLGDFTIQNTSLDSIVNFEQVVSNIRNENCQVVDARSNKRFLGEVKEPREISKSGHIPGSINIHYQSLFEGNLLKSKVELETIFKLVLEDNRPVILSCGSGVTACILYLVLEEYFQKSKYIYDGSWTEFGEKN